MFIRNKIGFVISIPEMFNHYKNILELLDRQKFELILMFKKDESGVIDTFNEKKYRYVFLEDVLSGCFIYRYLVTEHFFECRKSLYLQKLIGMINIRFMYALGKSRWNFSEWNNIYDLILCFGPYQIEKLNFCENAIKIPIGYPRYDKFFKENIDKEQLLKSLNCDVNKKTIVWLPTWNKLSSIYLYCETIASAAQEYNIIVKPHPLSVVNEPDKIEKIEELGFNYVVKENFDNTYLYAIADFVVADYGGPPFGAIYTDRNLLLLNLPGAEYDENTGFDSADIMLRESIVNIDIKDKDKFPTILSDEVVWNKQNETRKKLRDNLFAPYYGNSSEIAADVFKNLDELFKRGFIKKYLRVFILHGFYRVMLLLDYLKGLIKI